VHDSIIRMHDLANFHEWGACWNVHLTQLMQLSRGLRRCIALSLKVSMTWFFYLLSYVNHLNANRVHLKSFLEVKAYSQRSKAKKVGLVKQHWKTTLPCAIMAWTYSHPGLICLMWHQSLICHQLGTTPHMVTSLV